jgi:hypothetical protein
VDTKVSVTVKGNAKVSVSVNEMVTEDVDSSHTVSVTVTDTVVIIVAGGHVSMDTMEEVRITGSVMAAGVVGVLVGGAREETNRVDAPAVVLVTRGRAVVEEKGLVAVVAVAVAAVILVAPDGEGCTVGCGPTKGPSPSKEPDGGRAHP